MNSIRPAIAELERAFEALCPLFGCQMDLPVITVQSKGRKRALGWFCSDQWTREAAKLPEINISAENLARPPEDIAEVLVHEMAHYANHLDGIRDCTQFQYHNKWFKSRAESVGLVVERDGGHGWARTSLSSSLRQRIRGIAIDPAAFSLFRQSKEARKAPTKMKKWSCQCTNVRAAVELHAVCEQCGLQFTLQDQAVGG